ALDESSNEQNRLNEQIAASTDHVRLMENELSQAVANVLVELRDVIPAGLPMTLEQIQAGLETDECLVSFALSKGAVLLSVATKSSSKAEVLAQGEVAAEKLTELVRNARSMCSIRSAGNADLDPAVMHDLATKLLPMRFSLDFARARRLVILPD